jgi:hypothetical protein
MRPLESHAQPVEAGEERRRRSVTLTALFDFRALGAARRGGGTATALLSEGGEAQDRDQYGVS